MCNSRNPFEFNGKLKTRRHGLRSRRSGLARTLDVDASYVARILKLTSLAPDIVEAIFVGEEPPGISLAKLTHPFPEEWNEQRRLFGFANQ